MRVLDEKELQLVAGGWYNDSTGWTIQPDPNPDPYPYFPGDPWGGGGGGGGGGPQSPATPDFQFKGRGCPTDTQAAHDVLKELYDGSSTARDLMDKAFQHGTDIDIFKWDLSGVGEPDSFSDHTIAWDPFSLVSGQNNNGSTYVESPEMLLAHEFVHAGNWNNSSFQGPNSEAAVMAVTNQIAREMNATYGYNFETNRDNHTGRNYNAATVHDTIGGLRPDCP